MTEKGDVKIMAGTFGIISIQAFDNEAVILEKDDVFTQQRYLP